MTSVGPQEARLRSVTSRNAAPNLTVKVLRLHLEVGTLDCESRDATVRTRICIDALSIEHSYFWLARIKKGTSFEVIVNILCTNHQLDGFYICELLKCFCVIELQKTRKGTTFHLVRSIHCLLLDLELFLSNQ